MHYLGKLHGKSGDNESDVAAFPDFNNYPSEEFDQELRLVK